MNENRQELGVEESSSSEVTEMLEGVGRQIGERFRTLFV